MADIFISYRMSDSPHMAKELVRILSNAGWSVWYAPLAPGDATVPQIDAELKAAAFVVGLWSSTAHLSEHVRREFQAAAQAGKLIPCIASSDVSVPEEYRGEKIVLNLSKLVLHGYSYDLTQLLRALAAKLGTGRHTDIDALINAVIGRDFEFYQIGNLTVPGNYLFGEPREPFAPGDILTTDRDEAFEERSDYPALLRENYETLLENAKTNFGVTRITDNVLPRLDSFVQHPEDQADERGPLELNFSRTSYFKIWATNVAADIPVFDHASGQETTVRKSLCVPPYDDLAISPLSNNPSIEVVLISDSPLQEPRRQMIIRKRSEKVAGFQHWYQCSASGHMALAHKNAAGKPCPFHAAVAETRQEIAGNLEFSPEDFRLIGVVMKEQDIYPSFFGYFETDRPAVDIKHAKDRDRWEGYKQVIPFEPKAVFDHFGRHEWFPSSVLAIVAVLEAYYDYSEIIAAARDMPLKHAYQFYLDDNFVSDAAAEAFKKRT